MALPLASSPAASDDPANSLEVARSGGFPPTRFLVLATQRSGSSWVQEMLNSHPDTRVYTELFLAGATGAPMWEPRDIEFAESFLARRPRLTRPYWRVKYLQRIFAGSDAKAIGLKYMYDQVRHSPEVLPFAAARRVKVVHLIRRNLLDTVISHKLASATGLFHLAADDRPAVPWWPSERQEVRVRIDPGELRREFARLTRERQRMQRWLRLLRTPTIEVEYEALARDVREFAPVLEFLDLPADDAMTLNSALQKLRTRPQSNVVENFSEVQTALAGTQFEEFLEP